MATNLGLITIETVTQANEELLEEILAIDEEAFGLGSLNEWSLTPFLNYGRVYLARYEGRPAGIAELMRDWRDSELAYLYGYAVAQDYRNHGVATAMLSTMLEALPRSGFTRMQLMVHPENEIALYICENKFHMRRLEYIWNYFGHGEDRWLLEWNWEVE